MATATGDMMLLQLPTDRMILEHLQEGRNLGANIADDIDRHKKTVTKRLNQMEDYGLVTDIGNGVYELTPAGEIALANIDEYDRDNDRLQEIIERELAECDEG